MFRNSHIETNKITYELQHTMFYHGIVVDIFQTDLFKINRSDIFK